jgi:hypothetical protein
MKLITKTELEELGKELRQNTELELFIYLLELTLKASIIKSVKEITIPYFTEDHLQAIKEAGYSYKEDDSKKLVTIIL